MTVGLGCDGSASNDASDLWQEVRQAYLLAHLRSGAESFSARDALWLATGGSAGCLGRDDVGSIEPGARADVALFGVDGLAHAGTDADPVAGLLMGGPQRVRHLLVEGALVVRDGRLATADEEAIAREGHRVGRRIAENRP